MRLYDRLREKFSTINPEFKDGAKVNIYILQTYYNFINSHNFTDPNIFNEFDEVLISEKYLQEGLDLY